MNPAEQATPATGDWLIYLVFGSKTYHEEAFFSIVSALSWLASEQSRPEIHVFTDSPAFYETLPVVLHPVSMDQLAEWSGPHAYHFRAKHVVVELALRSCERAVLIDSDTFFNQSPQALFERVGNRVLLANALGHEYGTQPRALLYEALAADLQKMELAPDDMRLVNSGVIGLTRSGAGLLSCSIELMDRFRPQAVEVYTLEEFMLAVAAKKNQFELRGCTDVIFHYWSRKRIFRAKIQAWLAKHRESPLGQQALADVRMINDYLPRPGRWQRFLTKLNTLRVPAGQRQFVRELLNGYALEGNEFDQACGPVWWEKAVQNVQSRRPDVNSAVLREWLADRNVEAVLGRKRRDEIVGYLRGNGLL